MKDIRNERETFTINYIHGKTPKTQLLVRGITKNIPDGEVEAMMSHPTFKALYEAEKIEILLQPVDPRLELEGFKVVESKKNDEPLPVHESPRTSVLPDAPKPEERLPVLSKPQLLEMPGIGDGYAQKILSRQPEGGYESFGQLKGLNSDLTKLKEDNWTEIKERIEHD
jgi:hypothetical protein